MPRACALWQAYVLLIFIFQQVQCLVFGSFHYLAFARSLVVDAYKVQYAVDDDAVQFFVVGSALLLGVAEHGVKADDNVARYGVLDAHGFKVFSIVEGDDVGVVVVLQVLLVDFEYVFVITEHIAYVAYFLSVGCRYGSDPSVGVALGDFWHLYIFYVV